jgi:hypothetical protein
MLKSVVKTVFGRFGLSVQRTSTIERLLRDNERLRAKLPIEASANEPPVPLRMESSSMNGTEALLAERDRLWEALNWYEQRRNFFRVTEDYDALAKQTRIVDTIAEFGRSDFADLACWLFASALANHRVIHERIDEATTLWRAVKNSRGPILEVGRAAGGSTIAILGASGDRPVVSIDRGPVHAAMAEHIFARPDVRNRLKLYTQSSRESIAENEFGMMFVDADHSYEGVCHDIATFWNSLKSFDGRPPLAVFHDAAENPITFVEPVKRACDELVAQRGVARVAESWGSMLALEKYAGIDADRWYLKEDRKFWARFANAEFPELSPTRIRGQLNSASRLRKGTTNFIKEESLDHASWVKDGVSLDSIYSETDNPIRFVHETASAGRHAIEKIVPTGVTRFGFIAFLRPVRLKKLRLAIYSSARKPLAHTDFELVDASRVFGAQASPDTEILDAAYLYGNGFFRCELAVALLNPASSVIVAVEALGPSGESRYGGDADRGFLMNLASVREVQ